MRKDKALNLQAEILNMQLKKHNLEMQHLEKQVQRLNMIAQQLSLSFASRRENILKMETSLANLALQLDYLTAFSKQ